MIRAGNVLKLPHGDLMLPAFLPDATRGVVRAVDSADLEACGVGALVMNTYHLMQNPGSTTIRALGGLHKMSGWPRPIMTDSGGFQVYSLIRQNPKYWHGLDQLGAIAPGYQADLLVLPDLERFEPSIVLKRGKEVGEVPHPDVPEWVKHSVRIRPVTAGDFRIPWDGGDARVIGLVPDQVVTESLVETPTVVDGEAVADPSRDLVKIAVVERHLGTGRKGLGFVRGSGLARGALASSVAHDAHNIVVVGVDDEDMAFAVTRLAEIGGGIAAVEGGAVRAELPLAGAGLLADAPLAEVVERSLACNDAARALGWSGATPFLTLAFLALSVIPSLKITDRGLVDVDRFRIVPLEAETALTGTRAQ